MSFDIVLRESSRVQAARGRHLVDMMVFGLLTGDARDGRPILGLITGEVALSHGEC
jgi:hypothetical protein